MQDQVAATTGVDILRAPFVVADLVRRAQGDVLGVFGLGPAESTYRVIDSGTHWRLRHYADHDGSPTLLIVAAPIKRPYIWDLCPSASAIRSCLGRRANVHLLEWLPASSGDATNGMSQYVGAISDCVATITKRGGGTKPFLMGHSLGGTLAAIFGGSAPESIRGLVLLETPLCFGPRTSQFRDALTALVPPDLSQAEAFPGSLLSHLSALASPWTFIWSRLMDAAFSSSDARALDLHGRVERWALDEVPLPGRLVAQIVDCLYREDRLCRGTLEVGNTTVGPSRLSVPTFVVVNSADKVAPLASVMPFIDAMPTKDVYMMEYSGEVGVALQHLGVLIGRQAHARVWPEIMAWLDAHR